MHLTDPAAEETEDEDPLRILELLLEPGSEDMAASGNENSPLPPSPTAARRSARRRGQDRSGMRYLMLGKIGRSEQGSRERILKWT